MKRIKSSRTQIGFTLVEMAIVLAIVAMLLGGLLPTISSQMEQQHRSETRKQLDEIQQALIGFAILNGRLPCPADPTIPTVAANAGVERLTCITAANANGVLPWATLGTRETDGWNRRFTYSITPAFGAPITLTTPSTLDVLNASGGNSIASNMPAVIISHGQNGLGAYLPSGTPLPKDPTHTDENDNNDILVPNTTFVYHESTPNFDDLVIWISPNILFNRMVAAGKLP